VPIRNRHRKPHAIDSLAVSGVKDSFSPSVTCQESLAKGPSPGAMWIYVTFLSKFNPEYQSLAAVRAGCR
jgi:hypothetical protein